MRPHDIAPEEALCRSRSATDQNFEDFSVRAAVLHFGMPCRCVKDCRVGRTRPPCNDKIGWFCGKMGRFENSKVGNFPQGDISIVTLYYAANRSYIICASIYHTAMSCIALRPRPCFVSGCRAGTLKIAASGARALLAMTELAGFAGKRGGW